MRRTSGTKRIGMNWRMLAIAFGFMLLTLAFLALLSNAIGTSTGIAVAAGLVIVAIGLLLLDRPRK